MQTILHKVLIVFALLFLVPIYAVDMTIDDDLFVKGSLISEKIPFLSRDAQKKGEMPCVPNFFTY